MLNNYFHKTLKKKKLFINSFGTFCALEFYRVIIWPHQQSFIIIIVMLIKNGWHSNRAHFIIKKAFVHTEIANKYVGRGSVQCNYKRIVYSEVYMIKWVITNLNSTMMHHSNKNLTLILTYSRDYPVLLPSTTKKKIYWNKINPCLRQS